MFGFQSSYARRACENVILLYCPTDTALNLICFPFLIVIFVSLIQVLKGLSYLRETHHIMHRGMGVLFLDDDDSFTNNSCIQLFIYGCKYYGSLNISII